MTLVWFWVFGWILSIVAVIGNGLVIYLIATRRRLYTTANCFVLSLAVADFLFVLTFLPARKFACNGAHDSPCKTDTLKYMSAVLGLASVTNTCLLTLDRYMAIVKPLIYLTFMKSKRVVLLICVAWVLPTLLYLSPRLVWLFVGRGTPTQKTAETVIAFVFFVFALLSCTFLVIATGHVFAIVQRHSQRVASIAAQLRHNHRTGNSFYRRQINSAKVLGVVVAVFVVCYSVDIYVVVVDEFLKVPRNKFAELLLRILLVTNSTANPIVYAFYKRDIKMEARKLFCRFTNR